MIDGITQLGQTMSTLNAKWLEWAIKENQQLETMDYHLYKPDVFIVNGLGVNGWMISTLL